MRWLPPPHPKNRTGDLLVHGTMPSHHGARALSEFLEHEFGSVSPRSLTTGRRNEVCTPKDNRRTAVLPFPAQPQLACHSKDKNNSKSMRNACILVNFSEFSHFMNLLSLPIL